MERTSGSAAAREMNCCVEAAKLSYGWWTSRSPARIAAKMSTGSSSSGGMSRGGTTGAYGGSLRSGRSSPAICHRLVWSSMPPIS